MKISIFDYMDVRQFLQEFYKERKEHEVGFSYMTWAAQLGFSNKTILRLIVQGKRSISEKSRNAFLNYFGFPQLEKDYFDALIEYSQAKSSQKKQAMGARLIRLNRLNFGQKVVPADSGILNDVYGPIVVTVVSSADTPISSQEVARCVGLDLLRTEQVLSSLRAAGLLIQVENLFAATQATFKIADHFGHQSLRAYYSYWLSRSANAIELPPEVRRFRSLQVALTKEEFDETVQRINEFALTVLSRFEKNNLQERNVYLLNTALFPVMS